MQVVHEVGRDEKKMVTTQRKSCVACFARSVMETFRFPVENIVSSYGAIYISISYYAASNRAFVME